jgi:hypothetical protein
MWGEHTLRVFVHSALRKIFDPERKEVMEAGENCIFRGLLNCREQIKLWCGPVVVDKIILFWFLMCTYLLSGS